MITEVEITEEYLRNKSPQRGTQAIKHALTERHGCIAPYVEWKQIITCNGEIGTAFSNSPRLSCWIMRNNDSNDTFIEPITICLNTKTGIASIKKAIKGAPC